MATTTAKAGTRYVTCTGVIAIDLITRTDARASNRALAIATQDVVATVGAGAGHVAVLIATTLHPSSATAGVVTRDGAVPTHRAHHLGCAIVGSAHNVAGVGPRIARIASRRTGLGINRVSIDDAGRIYRRAADTIPIDTFAAIGTVRFGNADQAITAMVDRTLRIAHDEQPNKQQTNKYLHG